MADEVKAGSVVRDGAGTLVSTFLGAIAAASGFPIEAVVGASVVGQALGALGYDSIARRGESFVSTFRRLGYEGHEGDFDDEVRQRAKDPQFRDLTYQTLRQVRDALDDAVVPALAILLRDYTLPNVRPIDAYFRDFSDLLSHLSAQEYADLALLMDRVSAVYDQKSTYFTLAMSQQVPDKLTVGMGSRQGAPVTNLAIDTVENTRLLVRLFGRHNLTGDRFLGNLPTTVARVLGPPQSPPDTGANTAGVWQPQTKTGQLWEPGVNKNGVHWEVLGVLRFDTQQRIHSCLKRAAA